MRIQNQRIQKKKSNPIVLILLVLIIIGIIGFFTVKGWYNKNVFGPLSSEDSIEFEVTEGQTFTDVVKQFEEEGYIDSALAVQIYLRLNSINPSIKAGEYEIPHGYTLQEVIELMEAGTFKPAVWVTIREGLRYEEIAEILTKDIADVTSFDEAEFVSMVQNPNLIEFQDPEVDLFISNIVPSGNPLRGVLYPDTYRIDQDMTTTQIIEMMIVNFKNKVEANFELNNLALNQDNFSDLYSGLILASIIEKEASAWDDRAEISGVFHNRLATGIALQSDATVNFATGKNDAGVSFADQQVNSPYNTYMYPGLPPTPINNPRIESLVAALQPNVTDYVYFYHTPDGKTFFNVTFQEHLNGVCRDLGC